MLRLVITYLMYVIAASFRRLRWNEQSESNMKVNTYSGPPTHMLEFKIFGIRLLVNSKIFLAI